MECVSKGFEVTDEALPPSYLGLGDVVETATGAVDLGEAGKPPKRPMKRRRVLRVVGSGAARAPATGGDDDEEGEGEGEEEEEDEEEDVDVRSPPSRCLCGGFDAVTPAAVDAATTHEQVLDLLKKVTPRKLPPMDSGPVYVRQAATLRGHTSFLTFATLWVKEEAAPAPPS